MKENKRKGHYRRLKQEVIKLAAELMYFDGVKEYLTAKRMAAKQLGIDIFPSNTEIRDAVDQLAELYEPNRGENLHRMRRVALEMMELLQAFHPRLIGSVLDGAIKSTSDIDLHLFADEYEEVIRVLDERGLEYDFEMITTRKNNEMRDFPHVYVYKDGYTIELSIYEPREMRVRQRSSITGKPIEYATIAKLRKMLAQGD
ncbi:MAG: hypothetical protein ACE5PV_10440 [Candidatus Poribacteria bacterium]